MTSKFMKNMVEKILPYIILIAGVGIILLGFNGLTERRNFTKTTAEITDILYEQNVQDVNCRVFVKYTVDGKEYEKELGEYSSSMAKGGTLDIMYNPDDPTDITTASYTFVFVAFGMGTLSILAGIMMILKKRKNNKGPEPGSPEF